MRQLVLLLLLYTVYGAWDPPPGRDLFWDTDNVTCPHGYYNNFYDECKECSMLRQQYAQEKCCHQNTHTSMPFKYIQMTLGENDTFVQMLYTPAREICNHLRKEWSRCPKQCDIHLPGEICNRSSQCIGSRICLSGRCCKEYDRFCLSCDSHGLCNSCHPPYNVNATENKCGVCPSNKYSDNSICLYPSNCTAGEYVKQNYTLLSDRVCSGVPNGTYTNITNAPTFINHTNCTGENTTLVSNGNATRDSVCRETRRCPSDKLFLNRVWGADDNCTNRTTCQPGEYIIEGNYTFDNICNNCTSGTFTDTINSNTCSSHTVCEGTYRYTFYGNSTHDAQCLYYLYCAISATCLS